MKDIKTYVELILLIILVVCLYNGECKLIGDMLNNNLGKIGLLALVLFILNCFGKTAGILGACIFVFALHVHRREGFQEGAGIKLEIGNDTADKEKTKEKKIQANKEKDLADGDDEDEDEEFSNKREGFSIQIGSGSNSNGDKKEGYWERKNREDLEGGVSTDDVIESMKNQIKKISKKVKKLEKKKEEKEGFANLRQNRRLKINNISVLNTTDLDRIIKKDSEVRTINSTS